MRRSAFSKPVDQSGINMVDLMMWLVIAALLLAAALQSIGFYQKAAWNYQLQSDASAVRTYMETQYTLATPNAYPVIAKTTTVADLKLTTSNGAANSLVTAADGKGGWTATICSGALTKAGNVTKNGLAIGSAVADAKVDLATC